MAETTEIAWCDGTVNRWWGCAKVAPACDNCYAEAWSRRWDRAIWGPTAERVPVKSWRSTVNKLVRRSKVEGRRMRVFAQSMSDTFDNQAPDEWRAELFEAIRSTADHLDWLLLTKRIGNAERMLPADWGAGYPNAWLGISAGTQPTLDRDAAKLLNTPAAVRWVSLEPLLGPVDATAYMDAGYESGGPEGWVQLTGLDWVVVGGESGPGARPCDVDWIRRIVRDCRGAGVPAFVKQLGADPRDGCDRHPRRCGLPECEDSGRCVGRLWLDDRKGGDPSEWPEDLRVREFPEVTSC